MDVLELIRDEQGQPIATFPTFVAFQDWTEAEMAALQGLGRVERHAAGTVVIEPRPDDDHALFIIMSGELDVVRGGQSRGLIGAGDLVGELAFVDRQPRTGIVRARTESTLLRVVPADLERLAERDAKTALRFMREIARIVTFRLRTAWS